MAEYIEREAFIAHYRVMHCANCVGAVAYRNVPCRACNIGDILNAVEDYPAADVRPVAHGRWTWTETGEEDYEQFWLCSVCGEKIYWQTNYCPNCGALMDKDGDGE